MPDAGCWMLDAGLVLLPGTMHDGSPDPSAESGDSDSDATVSEHAPRDDQPATDIHADAPPPSDAAEEARTAAAGAGGGPGPSADPDATVPEDSSAPHAQAQQPASPRSVAFRADDPPGHSASDRASACASASDSFDSDATVEEAGGPHSDPDWASTPLRPSRSQRAALPAPAPAPAHAHAPAPAHAPAHAHSFTRPAYNLPFRRALASPAVKVHELSRASNSPLKRPLASSSRSSSPPSYPSSPTSGRPPSPIQPASAAMHPAQLLDSSPTNSTPPRKKRALISGRATPSSSPTVNLVTPPASARRSSRAQGKQPATSQTSDMALSSFSGPFARTERANDTPSSAAAPTFFLRHPSKGAPVAKAASSEDPLPHESPCSTHGPSQSGHDLGRVLSSPPPSPSLVPLPAIPSTPGAGAKCSFRDTPLQADQLPGVGQQQLVRVASTMPAGRVTRKSELAWICTCPEFKFAQHGIETRLRTCSHIRTLLGDEHDRFRLDAARHLASQVTVGNVVSSQRPHHGQTPTGSEPSCTSYSRQDQPGPSSSASAPTPAPASMSATHVGTPRSPEASRLAPHFAHSPMRTFQRTSSGRSLPPSLNTSPHSFSPQGMNRERLRVKKPALMLATTLPASFLDHVKPKEWWISEKVPFSPCVSPPTPYCLVALLTKKEFSDVQRAG